MFPFIVPHHLLSLLKDVVQRRCPEFLVLLDQTSDDALHADGREPISEALMDELSMSGLDAEGNPNERGVLLDELMGAFAWDDPNHPLPGFRPRG